MLHRSITNTKKRTKPQIKSHNILKLKFQRIEFAPIDISEILEEHGAGLDSFVNIPISGILEEHPNLYQLL
jgi:hypothetical protein